MAALMAVCTFISIPAPIPFTLQTFAVFLAAGLLGTKGALASIGVYVALGAAGLPVFSGFKGGLAVLIGPTGGYIVGFFAAIAIWGLITRLSGKGLRTSIIAALAGQLACYLFGTVWFVLLYNHRGNPIGFAAALSACVVPFILPDIIKIILASILAHRLRPALIKGA